MRTSLLISICFISSAFAQDMSCIRSRSGQSLLESTPSTCLDLTRLESATTKRDINDTFRNVMRGGFDEFPGSSFFGSIMDEVQKHENTIPYMDRAVNDELVNVLNTYTNNMHLEGYSKNPDSHLNVLRSSINYSMELGKLLDHKNLKDSEKDLIRKEMQNILQLGSVMYAKLNSDLHKYSRSTQDRLSNEMKAMETAVKNKLEIKDIAKITDALANLNKSIENLEHKLSLMEKDATSNKEDIAGIKKDLANLKATRNIQSENIKRDIQNYSQFAQGMAALYSLFNPSDAAKINNAIAGITNMAMGYAALSSVAAGAAAGATLGPYGMIAMGAVQLFNSFQSNKDSNGAFKAIFKQLKMISEQITDLQERMDSKFHKMEGTILLVERNIISKINEIGSNVNDIRDMMDFSIRSLNEIDYNLKDLNNFIVNQSIKEKVRNSYFSTVEKCLGKDTIKIKIKRKVIKQCLDEFEAWVKEDISSSLMTRKTLNGQYSIRGDYDWQINDLLSFYQNYTSVKQDKNLANPQLLKDLSDNLKILKDVNHKQFDDELAAHPVFQLVQSEEKAFGNFIKLLDKDDKILPIIKENYKKRLLEIHAQISDIKDKQESRIMDHHKKELAAFKKSLSDEIIMRGNVTDSDDKLTMNILKDYLAAAEAVKYDRDAIELVQHDKIIVFARACQMNDPLNIQIPIPLKYLKQTLGNDLAKRFVLNSATTTLCYDVKTETNKHLYSYRLHGRFDHLRNFELSLKSPLITDYVQGSYQWNHTHYNQSRKGKYKGDFLRSITLKGYFNGTMLLNDTFHLDERLPLRNQSSDRFSLLALIKGERYSRKFYPVATYGITISKLNIAYSETVDNNFEASKNMVPEMQNSQGGLLMNLGAFTTHPDILNLRNDMKAKDQREFLKNDKLISQVGIIKAVEEFMQEKLKTQRLDEAGKILGALIYFRSSPNALELLNTNLSETWGLRSGVHLKRFYSDALSMDTSSAALDYVLENQLKFLEQIK